MTTKQPFVSAAGWLCVLANILFLHMPLTGQSHSHSILSLMAAASADDSAEIILLDWTIGEPIVTTVRFPSGLLTQGFQQPNSAIKEFRSSEAITNQRLFVVPNPARTIIRVRFARDIDASVFIQLFDSLGQMLEARHHSSSLDVEMDMSQNASGIYILTARDQNGTYLGSRMITKID